MVESIQVNFFGREFKTGLVLDQTKLNKLIIKTFCSSDCSETWTHKLCFSSAGVSSFFHFLIKLYSFVYFYMHRYLCVCVSDVNGWMCVCFRHGHRHK